MNSGILKFNKLLIITLIIMNACSTNSFRYFGQNNTEQVDFFKKVLVIGIDPNKRANMFIEKEVVHQLKAQGIDAIEGHTVFPEDTILEKKIIISKSKELGVDGIVKINFYDLEETGTISYYGSTYEKEFSTYHLKCCHQVSSGLTGIIETRIFDKKYERLLWSSYSEIIFSLGTFPYDVKLFFEKLFSGMFVNDIIK